MFKANWTTGEKIAIGFTLVFIAGILGLFAWMGYCIANQHPEPTYNNPRHGKVVVDSHTSKRCDGRTLIYHDDYSGSISIVTHSPECGK